MIFYANYGTMKRKLWNYGKKTMVLWTKLWYYTKTMELRFTKGEFDIYFLFLTSILSYLFISFLLIGLPDISIQHRYQLRIRFNVQNEYCFKYIKYFSKSIAIACAASIDILCFDDIKRHNSRRIDIRRLKWVS